MAYEPQPGWSYKPGESAAQPTENSVPEPAAPQPEEVPEQPIPSNDNAKLGEAVSWTASEFVHNHKNANWHLSYFLVLAIFVATVFLLTRDIISAVSITIVGFLFIIIANRKPRQLPYEVNNKGVGIGDKFYNYEAFKSFSLTTEEAVGCISFLPLHRFMPEISVYFPPEEGDKIINLISEHLPNDQTQQKKVDSIFKKIKF